MWWVASTSKSGGVGGLDHLITTLQFSNTLEAALFYVAGFLSTPVSIRSSLTESQAIVTKRIVTKVSGPVYHFFL